MPRLKRVVGVSLLLTQCCPVLFAADAAATPAGREFKFHEREVLGTALDLIVVATQQRDADAAHAAVLAEVERLRGVLSSYDAKSDLGRLNAAAVGSAVPVADELIDVLKQYDVITARSGGAYRGNLGALIDLWKTAEQTQTLPTDAQIVAAVEKLKAPAWKIDEVAKTVARLTDQPINVDSLGKGYILGKAVAAARAKVPNVTGVLLSIGGDIRVSGLPAKGEAWTIGVQNPATPELNAKPLTTLNVVGTRSIATSGAYARFYTINGKQYSHILNGKTGQPANNTAATVVARDSATANALATALCVMRTNAGFELVRSFEDAECMVVLPDGKQMRSNGFKDLEAAAVVDATKTPKQWPAGFRVTIPLETEQTERKPYVYVWVTDLAGKHVKTIGAWGNEARWMKDVQEWWKVAKDDTSLQKISRATMKPGKYKVAWDGTDQKGNGVPPGQYKVWVQVAAEHGPNVAKSTTIDCGKTAAKASIAASSAFKAVPISYGPVENQ